MDKNKNTFDHFSKKMNEPVPLNDMDWDIIDKKISATYFYKWSINRFNIFYLSGIILLTTGLSCWLYSHVKNENKDILPVENSILKRNNTLVKTPELNCKPDTSHPNETSVLNNTKTSDKSSSPYAPHLDKNNIKSPETFSPNNKRKSISNSSLLNKETKTEDHAKQNPTIWNEGNMISKNDSKPNTSTLKQNLTNSNANNTSKNNLAKENTEPKNSALVTTLASSTSNNDSLTISKQNTIDRSTENLTDTTSAILSPEIVDSTIHKPVIIHRTDTIIHYDSTKVPRYRKKKFGLK